MPMTVSVDDSGTLTTITGTGEIAYEEIVDAIRFYYDRPTEKVLWLMTEVDVGGLPTSAVEKIAALSGNLRQNAPRGRTAIVSPETLTYGLSRMFQSLLNLNAQSDGRETMVFQDTEEALQWIGEKGD
jgi:hypothetical protein